MSIRSASLRAGSSSGSRRARRSRSEYSVSGMRLGHAAQAVVELRVLDRIQLERQGLLVQGQPPVPDAQPIHAVVAEDPDPVRQFLGPAPFLARSARRRSISVDVDVVRVRVDDDDLEVGPEEELLDEQPERVRLARARLAAEERVPGEPGGGELHGAEGGRAGGAQVEARGGPEPGLEPRRSIGAGAVATCPPANGSVSGPPSARLATRSPSPRIWTSRTSAVTTPGPSARTVRPTCPSSSRPSGLVTTTGVPTVGAWPNGAVKLNRPSPKDQACVEEVVMLEDRPDGRVRRLIPGEWCQRSGEVIWSITVVTARTRTSFWPGWISTP